MVILGAEVNEDITFKYHPNVYINNTLKHGNNICQCCGEPVKYWYSNMYSVHDIHCVCLKCIHSGEAADKFNGSFIEHAQTDKVDDQKKIEELFERTPGYISWQGEYWLACCNDFCAFIDSMNLKELRDLHFFNEILRNYSKEEIEDIENLLMKDENARVYLFQCLTCQKFYIYTDSN